MNHGSTLSCKTTKLVLVNGRIFGRAKRLKISWVLQLREAPSMKLAVVAPQKVDGVRFCYPAAA